MCQRMARHIVNARTALEITPNTLEVHCQCGAEVGQVSVKRICNKAAENHGFRVADLALEMKAVPEGPGPNHLLPKRAIMMRLCRRLPFQARESIA